MFDPLRKYISRSFYCYTVHFDNTEILVTNTHTPLLLTYLLHGAEPFLKS